VERKQESTAARDVENSGDRIVSKRQEKKIPSGGGEKAIYRESQGADVGPEIERGRERETPRGPKRGSVLLIFLKQEDDPPPR